MKNLANFIPSHLRGTQRFHLLPHLLKVSVERRVAVILSSMAPMQTTLRMSQRHSTTWMKAFQMSKKQEKACLSGTNVKRAGAKVESVW